MAKGSKILNPADKARKEARKKELKKNKKQRQQVRSAAIKGRDPESIISELEKLDKLEFDPESQSNASEALYKEKRKRLKETYSRLLAHYQKEDAEMYAKLQKLEFDYNLKHEKMDREYQAMKAAKEVKIEDIFLPPDETEIADDDPLMSETIYIDPIRDGLKPPGCPPGFPPTLKQIMNEFTSSFQSLTSQSRAYQLAAPKQSEQSQGKKIRYGDIDSTQKVRHIRVRSDSSKGSQAQETSKAVIESKPVIFKPRVTKFVPSSVGRKIIQKSGNQ